MDEIHESADAEHCVLKETITSSDGEEFATGTHFVILENEKSYSKLKELSGQQRTLFIIKGTESGRMVLAKFQF